MAVTHSGYKSSNYWMTSEISIVKRQFRWPCGLRRKSAAAMLLEWRDRIPLRARMFVSCVWCVLCRRRPLRWADHSFSGVLPNMSLIICDPRTWTIKRPRTDLGRSDTKNTMKVKVSDRSLMSNYSGIFLRRMRKFTKNLSLSRPRFEPGIFRIQVRILAA